MYPEGHARSASGNLSRLLSHKFRRLASLGVADADGLYERLTGLAGKPSQRIQQLYAFELSGAESARS